MAGYMIEREAGTPLEQIVRRRLEAVQRWGSQPYAGEPQQSRFDYIVNEAGAHGLVPYNRIVDSPRAYLVLHVINEPIALRSLASYINGQISGGKVGWLLSENATGTVNYRPLPRRMQHKKKASDCVIRIWKGKEDAQLAFPVASPSAAIYKTAAAHSQAWEFNDDTELCKRCEEQVRRTRECSVFEHVELAQHRLQEALDQKGELFADSIRRKVITSYSSVFQIMNIMHLFNNVVTGRLEQWGIPYVAFGPRMSGS